MVSFFGRSCCTLIGMMVLIMKTDMLGKSLSSQNLFGWFWGLMKTSGSPEPNPAKSSPEAVTSKQNLLIRMGNWLGDGITTH